MLVRQSSYLKCFIFIDVARKIEYYMQYQELLCVYTMQTLNQLCCVKIDYILELIKPKQITAIILIWQTELDLHWFYTLKTISKIYYNFCVSWRFILQFLKIKIYIIHCLSCSRICKAQLSIARYTNSVAFMF